MLFLLGMPQWSFIQICFIWFSNKVFGVLISLGSYPKNLITYFNCNCLFRNFTPQERNSMCAVHILIKNIITRRLPDENISQREFHWCFSISGKTSISFEILRLLGRFSQHSLAPQSFCVYIFLLNK